MPYECRDDAEDAFVGFHEEDGAIDVGWEGWGSYRVEGPPAPIARAVLCGAGATDGAVCFLVSVLPFSLPLFGLEPFHGSAVKIEGRALCILGESGAGKSSIAAALTTIGYELLADDACAIDEMGLLWPGPPLLSLRQNGAAGHFDQAKIVARYADKTYVASSVDATGVVPGAIVILDPDRGASLALRRMEGGEAFARVIGQSRGPTVLADRRRETQLRAAAALSSVPCGVISFDPVRHDQAMVAQTVAEWWS
jgi:hypothetical protein